MTTNTDYSKKCQVLAEFWVKHKDNPELTDFFNYHDIGLPLAFIQEYNFCVATDKGIEEINQAFNDLVTIVENGDEHFELVSNFLNEHLID